MTTIEERHDTTPPPPIEAKEANGKHKSKRPATRKAAPRAEALPLQPPPTATRDILDTIAGAIEQLDAEERAAQDRLNRIRDLRQQLTGKAAAPLRWEPASLMPQQAPSARRERSPRAARTLAKRHRRTAAEIGSGVDKIVALVAKRKGGMRAEQIRKTLKLDAKEMPMLLKTALGDKRLRTTGQKRATTYFAK